LVEVVEPDIVVVTAGAHIHTTPFMEEALAYFFDLAEEWKTSRPNMKVAWKSQQPAGCSEGNNPPFGSRSLAPLGKMQPDGTIAGLRGDNPQQYNHGEFWEWDADIISRMEAAGIDVLDMRMTYERLDAHPGSTTTPGYVAGRDCLHMCSPGPLEVVPVLLLQLLEAWANE
jgi:hypothetical protein